MSGLKQILDRHYRDFDFRGRLLKDPIEFPHRYKDPADIEVSAFIAASLAYGRIDLFKPVIGKILSVMGTRPAGFLSDFAPKRHSGLFNGISYRFNRTEDIVGFLYLLHVVIRDHGSMKGLFMDHYSKEDRNIRNALTGMVGGLLAADMTMIYGSDIKPGGLLQLLPSPAGGSACKRQNLFLRWMVRDRDIDFGLWNEIPANKLVIPLDTHIMKISRCLGLTKRGSADWKTAEEITDSLKRFDPEDPLKYDFALCHHGISGLCRGEHYDASCAGCAFRGHDR